MMGRKLPLIPRIYRQILMQNQFLPILPDHQRYTESFTIESETSRFGQ